VRRIPVLDRDMRLVGMVTVGDLASRADADIDDTLKQLSRPSPASGPSADEEIVRLHRPQSDTADGRF
jgi:CBS domain-containing protein